MHIKLNTISLPYGPVLHTCLITHICISGSVLCSSLSKHTSVMGQRNTVEQQMYRVILNFKMCIPGES